MNLAVHTQALVELLRVRRGQWRSPDELRRRQLRRLRRLLCHAGENVPYYRDLFARVGFAPADLTSLRDLRCLPVTTKADIQRDPDAFVSRTCAPHRLRAHLTSGSTGRPLRILQDRQAIAVSTALKAYAFLECGVRLTDRFVSVARSAGPAWPNHHIVSPMSDTAVIAEALRRLKPDVLYSYPSHLPLLASCDLTGVRPRLVFSQGLTLTGQCREVVRSLFGVEAFDTYGSIEFSRLAFECPEHAGLHTITDWAVIEFLADGEPAAPGEPGDIVVTGLHNFAQPLIRYALGDVGVPSDRTCPCGRSWPLIAAIEGRTLDFLTMPSGRRLSPGVVFHSLHPEANRNLFCVSQFQVVQVKQDHVVLNVVPGHEFDPAAVARMRDNLVDGFAEHGETVQVETHVVEELEKGRTGKVQMIVSHVA